MAPQFVVPKILQSRHPNWLIQRFRQNSGWLLHEAIMDLKVSSDWRTLTPAICNYTDIQYSVYRQYWCKAAVQLQHQLSHNLLEGGNNKCVCDTALCLSMYQYSSQWFFWYSGPWSQATGVVKLPILHYRQKKKMKRLFSYEKLKGNLLLAVQLIAGRCRLCYKA